MNERQAVEALVGNLARFGEPPPVVVVTGSGLFGAVERFSLETERTFADLGAPESSVRGHPAKAQIRVDGAGRRLMCLLGRVHAYEGRAPAEVVRLLRAAVRWGCRTVVLTNAAGGLRPDAAVGELMAISDHINLTGLSPLVGPNVEDWGQRFVDMSAVYCPALMRRLRPFVASTGVYAGVLGPEYETPAMVRFLRHAGADAVGMSTVLEAIACRHMGARIAGISCLTNLAAGLSPEALSHAEVQKNAPLAQEALSSALEAILSLVADPSENG